ncbi:Plasma membrane calcium-transporting ATPase 4 [Lamellibrachia satsuma]|nr:Plasma membrane calcium-transporting ATPase 4 [Lamellibrachia satsuma]
MLATAVGINSQAGIIFALLGAAEIELEEEGSKQKSNTIAVTETAEKNKGKKNNPAAPLAPSEDIKLKNKSHLSEAVTTTTEEPTTTSGEGEPEVKNVTVNKKEKSVLQAKLTKLAIQIGYGGTVIAVMTVMILILRYSITHFVIKKEPWHVSHIRHYVNHFIVGVTVLVVAVPEGLPLAVTLALAYSVRKMMFDNNLVRHLDACETMGNATAICSDKTGTLTTNRMTVVQCFLAGKTYKSLPNHASLPKPLVDLIIYSISINSGYTSRLLPPREKGGYPTQVGNKTECALLGFVTDIGKSYSMIREEIPEDTLYKVYTFNSQRKSMTTVIQLNNGNFRVFTKGASEILLKKCKFIIGQDGKFHSFPKIELHSMVDDVIEPMASQGLRTICVAYRDFVKEDPQENETLFSEEPDWEMENEIVSKLTCLCVLGIEDPVRDEVRLMSGDSRTSLVCVLGIEDAVRDEVRLMSGDSRTSLICVLGIEDAVRDEIRTNVRRQLVGPHLSVCLALKTQ